MQASTENSTALVKISFDLVEKRSYRRIRGAFARTTKRNRTAHKKGGGIEKFTREFLEALLEA